jgi:hypothetical protein
MKLHTNTQDFNELIRLTATHFSILPEFIEKDYWITLILNNLSLIVILISKKALKKLTKNLQNFKKIANSNIA